MCNDYKEREEKLKHLVNWQKQNALPLIIALINDSDPVVRAEAVMVIGKAGNKELYGSLVKALGDEDQHVRFCAAEALGNLGSEYAIESLMNTAKENSEFVRCRAINALGKINSSEQLNFLIETLSDPCETVCQEAELAIENLLHLAECQDALIKFFENDSLKQQRFLQLYKMLQIQLKATSFFS